MDFNPGLLRTSMAHMWRRAPLPGLSVPVPGHCCLNRSWLAIWTGKCAKGWHMRGWITVAPLFHTVERNIRGEKNTIHVSHMKSSMCAATLFIVVNQSSWIRLWIFISVMHYYNILIWSMLLRVRQLGCLFWLFLLLNLVHDELVFDRMTSLVSTQNAE